eukprot:Awhi_evm1s9367
MTPSHCSSLCHHEGYDYAGLQHYSECYCARKEDIEDFTKHEDKVEDSQCNTHCEGDHSIMCGGGFRMSIYAIGANSLTP